MTIKIKKEDCIGCALCVTVAEKTFKMNDEENKAEVINETGDDPETIKSAVDCCPTQAIVME